MLLIHLITLIAMYLFGYWAGNTGYASRNILPILESLGIKLTARPAAYSGSSIPFNPPPQVEHPVPLVTLAAANTFTDHEYAPFSDEM